MATHEIALRGDRAFDGAGDPEAGGDRGPRLALPESMNDAALDAPLYASSPRSKRGHRRIEEPGWAAVHRELRRKHVTF